jgi:uncharacterized membrane protein
MDQHLGSTSTGIQPNAAATLSYLLGFITGLIFYFMEKENAFVRFHAMQSTLVFGLLFVLGFILHSVPFLGWVLWAIKFFLWIFLMFKAYQGEYFKVPILGDIAERNS